MRMSASNEVLKSLELGEPPDFAALDVEDWRGLAAALAAKPLGRRQAATLASACADRDAALPVLEVLATNLTLSLALAKSAVAPDNLERIRSALRDSGLSRELNAGRLVSSLVVPLARVFADARTWRYLLGVVLNRAVVSALPEVVRDSDREVRVQAVKAIATLDGHDATEALFRALGDEASTVRDTAFLALKDRLPAEELTKRLESDLHEVEAMQEAAHAAAGPLAALAKVLPALHRLFDATQGLMAAGGQGIASIGRAVGGGLAAAASGVVGVFKGKEEPAAVSAVAIALGWADGRLDDDEQVELSRLLELIESSDEDRARLKACLSGRPEPENLAPFIKRLKRPEAVVARFDGVFGKGGEDYLTQVAVAAGLPPSALCSATRVSE